MKPMLTLLIAIWANLVLAADAPWQPLFNGKSLAGWEMVTGKPDSWRVVDGVMYCTGEGGGWLSTTKEYSNFELRLQFRLPPGGNSGVFIRSPREGDPAYTGMEIQVLDDAAEEYKALRPDQYTGSIYGVQAAQPRVTKPAGQWQHMHIRCEGRHVTVVLNDTTIVDTDLDQHQDVVKEHPGIQRTGGFIGLQNHSSPVEYSQVIIRELP